MLSYPSLEADALAAVGKAARLVATGQLNYVDKPQAVRACWSLLGYGLSLGMPSPSMEAQDKADFNQLADQLESLGTGKMQALPWGNILKTVLALLMTLLAG